MKVLESGVLGLIIPFSSDRIFERAFNQFMDFNCYCSACPAILR